MTLAYLRVSTEKQLLGYSIPKLGDAVYLDTVRLPEREKAVGLYELIASL
jgi:hypothetical protein